ncbi:MAG: gamma carbonic anhydrase family protein [Sulfolobaceae archaeon]
MPIEEYLGKRPKISPRAWVHPTAYIIGDVEIGEMSSIWHYVVIRGDNDKIRIGKYSNIQENSTVHTDLNNPVEIGDMVTVGHNAVIHGAKIESHVIVGMGAILLNGCKIGEYTIIGAGAVVTQNTEIPPYSLALGVPAKVIRKLREDEIKMIDSNAEEYVAHVRRFLKL